MKLREVSQRIKNVPGVSETNLLTFDSAISGQSFVNADLGEFEQAIKDLWRSLYPDRSGEIIDEAASEVLQSMLQTDVNLVGGALAVAAPGPGTAVGLFLTNAYSLGQSIVVNGIEGYKKWQENKAKQQKLREELAANLTSLDK